MKVEISTNSVDKDDTNFLAFFTSTNVADPSTITLDAQEVPIEDDEDKQDELFDS